MAQISFRANVGQVKGLQFSQDGKPRFQFSAAENHSRFDKQKNQYVEIGTSWYNITVFGRHAEDLADVIQENAKQQVVVFGRMSTRSYDRQDGSKGESLDVVADNVGIVHRAPQQAQGGYQQQPQAQQSQWTQQPANDPWAGGFQQPQQGEVPF